MDSVWRITFSIFSDLEERLRLAFLDCSLYTMSEVLMAWLEDNHRRLRVPSEFGNVNRFDASKQLMSFAGLVPVNITAAGTAGPEAEMCASVCLKRHCSESNIYSNNTC